MKTSNPLNLVLFLTEIVQSSMLNKHTGNLFRKNLAE